MDHWTSGPSDTSFYLGVEGEEGIAVGQFLTNKKKDL